jgi:hypothetical protein
MAHKFPKVPPVSLTKDMNHIHLTYEMSEDRRQRSKVVPIGQQMSAELRKNLNALLPDVRGLAKGDWPLLMKTSRSIPAQS